jgi:hypothetical protein
MVSFRSFCLAAIMATTTKTFVRAEDLMAVCYSFTSVDMCHPNAPATAAEATPAHERKLLAKQGPPRSSPEYQKRRALTAPASSVPAAGGGERIECGVFCSGWSTFCAEYMCDADTIGLTCDEMVAEAKEHMDEIATTVGTEDCTKQMATLECICVDQDK